MRASRARHFWRGHAALPHALGGGLPIRQLSGGEMWQAGGQPIVAVEPAASTPSL